MRNATDNFLLRSHGPIWQIEQKSDATIRKSRAAAQNWGEPLAATRFVRLMQKSESHQTMSQRFSPLGSPEFVQVWLTRTDKAALEDRLFGAVQAGTVPADSVERFGAGTLNLSLVKHMLGVRSQDPDDHGGSEMRKAYSAHAADPRTTKYDLRAAAHELDQLADRLNAGRS